MAPSPCSRIAAAVERDTVSADEEKDIRPPALGLFGEVDDLRDVGEVIAGKRDHVGWADVDGLQIRVLALDLEIEQPDLMPGLTRRLRDQLQTERLEAKKDLGVHERAGMHGEQYACRLSPLTRLRQPVRAPSLGQLRAANSAPRLANHGRRRPGAPIMLCRADRTLDQIAAQCNPGPKQPAPTAAVIGLASRAPRCGGFVLSATLSPRPAMARYA